MIALAQLRLTEQDTIRDNVPIYASTLVASMFAASAGTCLSADDNSTVTYVRYTEQTT